MALQILLPCCHEHRQIGLDARLACFLHDPCHTHTDQSRQNTDDDKDHNELQQCERTSLFHTASLLHQKRLIRIQHWHKKPQRQKQDKDPQQHDRQRLDEADPQPHTLKDQLFIICR